jgi:hypothetical protein
MYFSKEVSDQMRTTYNEVVSVLMKSGLTDMQAAAVIAQMLSIAFRVEGITKEEAIQRFTEVATFVYAEFKEDGTPVNMPH